MEVNRIKYFLSLNKKTIKELEDRMKVYLEKLDKLEAINRDLVSKVN